MEVRRSGRVLEAMGLFPPAKVVRGHDWCWGQQDGESDLTLSMVLHWWNLAVGVYTILFAGIWSCLLNLFVKIFCAMCGCVDV